jgi:CheY-like chemotaxis protein
MMDGEITVTSEPGKGSIFSFSIHLEKSKTKAQESDSEISPKIQTKHFLIVDDNSTNRKILSGLLDNMKIKYSLAENGKAAYEKILREAQSKDPFDIILLDYHMPVMDGLEMAMLLKKENKITPPPDIVLLSSDDVSLQRKKIGDYGIKRYMIKPVFRNDLIKVLNELVSDGEDQSISKKVYRQKQSALLGKSYNVLLAEDNIINQKLANGLLQNLGCKVTIVDNGKKAVDILKEKTFDLIFMDVQMPEMDGFEATGRIRDSERESGEHIPIIAMTAHAMKGDREKCLNAGMDEYVTKPISIKSVSDAIKRLSIEQKS